MNMVLSLFPGIGLLDQAFEEEGFCVVRGPDLMWGGDVTRFRPPAGLFDGVIGGPPCQAFSRLRFLIEANGYRTAPNLIPEFERILDEAMPRWFVMENVPDAPQPRQATGSSLVCDADCGGLTSRLRRFSWSGFELDLPPVTGSRAAFLAVTCDARDVPVASGSGKLKRRNQTGGTAPHEGRSLSTAEMLRRQGFDPAMLDECPITESGKRKMVGNGVPFAMGLAIARAVRRATEQRAA
jgi:DNA (cytosine-5)-methyltransferase 1